MPRHSPLRTPQPKHHCSLSDSAARGPSDHRAACALRPPAVLALEPPPSLPQHSVGAAITGKSCSGDLFGQSCSSIVSSSPASSATTSALRSGAPAPRPTGRSDSPLHQPSGQSKVPIDDYLKVVTGSASLRIF